MPPVDRKDLEKGLEDERWHQVSKEHARHFYSNGLYEVECRFLMGKWRKPEGLEEIGDKPNMRYRVRKQPTVERKGRVEGLTMEARGRESDREVIRAHTRLNEAKAAMEAAILATPTGKRRNRLTEVNMQMMLLEEGIKAALVIRVNEGEG